MTAQSPLTAVILDAGSLGPDLDFGDLEASADTWHWHETTQPQEIASRVSDADIVVTNKVVLDSATISAAPRLRLICLAATGSDNIDLDAAAAAGITVCNATGYATPAVVQHVFALLLALATRIHDYHQAVRSGHWAQSPHFCLHDFPITELAGRTLGIVGYGELGRAVAAVARGFGMNVLIAARPGTDRVPPGRVGLEALLAESDAVTLHCPLTPETRALIGARELRRMRPNAWLINTARGGLVDEQALAEALRSGMIAGAGVDVLSREPPRDGNPLLAPDIPNLILTPHCAWASRDARQRLVHQIAQNIRAYRAGEPRNVVRPAFREA